MQSFFSKIAAFFMSVVAFISGLFGFNADPSVPAKTDAVRYPAYFGARSAVAQLPGLDEGFVPQGITYIADEDVYILCGYMDEDGAASRLYALHDGVFTGLTLLKKDGSVYTGHAGGVTAAGEFIYISNANRLYVLEKRAVLSAKDGDAVAFAGSIEVPCRASFCSSDGERVYVGEFHKDPDYETDPSHKLTSPDGRVFKALVFAYELSPDARFGVVSDIPAAAYSTCDSVQGFALLPGDIAALSCSYGAFDSKLLCYDCSGGPEGYFPLDGANVPLYYLTPGKQTARVRLPARSEDIECRGGDLLIVFESGARPYYSRSALKFVEKQIVRLTADALLA